MSQCAVRLVKRRNEGWFGNEMKRRGCLRVKRKLQLSGCLSGALPLRLPSNAFGPALSPAAAGFGIAILGDERTDKRRYRRTGEPLTNCCRREAITSWL